MRAAGAQKDASLPVAFIENSSHCSTNAAGEKVIGPNKDRRWLPELMAQVWLLTAALLCSLGQTTKNTSGICRHGCALLLFKCPSHFTNSLDSS